MESPLVDVIAGSLPLDVYLLIIKDSVKF